MLNRFTEYVRAEGLLHEGDAVVVGLSGGCDSVCLFLFLLDVAEELKLDIAALHVNHMIRGKEAERDENFVRKLCEDFGVPFKVKKIDVPTYAKEHHLSEEEAGRLVRREAFAGYGKEVFDRSFVVALAHHGDDNAETILYRMARGTGITGLGGIAPKGQLSFNRKDIKVIHPMLLFNKAEIKAELEKRRASWVEDATNDEVAYARNRIRNEVVPALEEVNAAATDHILAMASDIRVLTDYLKRQADIILEKYMDEEGGLDASAITGSDEALHAILLSGWLEAQEVSAKDFSRKHINSIVALAKAGKNGRLSLMRGVECLMEYGRLSLKKTSRDSEAKDCFVEISTDNLKKKSEISAKICGWQFDFSLKKPDEAVLGGENSFYICLTYDKIHTVCLRNRRQGDEIVIAKDGKKKSIRRLLIDKKVPGSVRDSIPLLVCNDKVVWVCGVRRSMDFLVDDETQVVLVVEAKRDRDYE